MKNRVFVTGATGFIGSNLVKKLAEMDCVVYALFRELPDKKSENKKIIYLKGDTMDVQNLNLLPDNIDTLFHCAALISFRKKDFQKAYQVNVEGTRNILEAAYKSGVKKVVYLSACAVLGYSNNEKKTLDESSNPRISKSNIYAYTKMKSEQVVQEYISKGLDVSIANIATVYGPGDRKMNSGTVIKAIYENRLRFAPPGGTSYVAVDDLVDGLILLAEKGITGERYIFCNQNLTFLNLFNRIAKVLNRSEIRFKVPRWTYIPAVSVVCVKNKIAGNSEKGINLVTPQIIKESYNYKYYSSKKARDILEWKPKKSLEEAVVAALEFYKKEGLM